MQRYGSEDVHIGGMANILARLLGRRGLRAMEKLMGMIMTGLKKFFAGG
jgi:small neutral amino acid transporter SnatA (MarC family)